MKWETVRFDSLYEIESRNGLTKPSKVRGSGYKMINMGELFANDRIYDIPMELVPLKNGEKNCKVEQFDLLFARQSLVLEGAGKCSIVMEVSPLTVFESHLIRVRLNKDIADPLFYYYYFRSPFSPIKSIVSQCAQAGIRGSDLSLLEVICPPLKQQKNISSVLSSYDSLIENNQKQIKLLEEAAQRLYKEWFIDLRFPGYETTPIVDGVPEGWEKTTVEKATTILRRGISPSYDENGDSTVINQKCIRQTIVDLGEARKQTKKYPSELNLQAGDTVICSTGDGTLGRVGQVFGELENTTLDSHVTLVRAASNIGAQLLFWTVKSQQAFLQGMGKGSTNQLELSRSVIQELPIILPDPKTRMAFETLAQAIHDKIAAQNKQILALQTARDRLLSKLMSGEIEV